MSQYRKNVSAVFTLKYHIVWCPKYRLGVLTGKVENRLKRLIYKKAEEHSFIIHALEIMPDHVHLFIEADPTWAIAGIAHAIKGYTSRILRKEFKHLTTRLPTLWSKSYFAATVGNVTEATIKKYIDEQKRR